MKKSMRFSELVFFCLLFFYCPNVDAQTPFDGHSLLADSVEKHRVDSPAPVPKRFGRACLFLGLAEVVPWVYDRYVTKKDYTRISLGTIRYNLKPGSWAWDNDIFQTNQFGHPYHGSLFFNSFRVNGYNFWQSAPAVLAGSYIWESLAENQAPSPNDFINTSFGGIVLGEMTHRLSRKLVNNNSRGVKRQVGEILAFVMNPMNGLTRITSGKWGKLQSGVYDSSAVSAEFDIGLRRFNTENTTVEKGRMGLYTRVKLLYGHPHENYQTPFSNILINAEFGQDDSTLLNTLNVYGTLAGWELSAGEKGRHLAIVSANYDFIQNNAFFYGGQSVKADLFSEYKLGRGIALNTSVGMGPVVLAAVPDKYLYKGRNYDYTSGLSLLGGCGLNIGNKLLLSIDYRGNWLHTINGNPSHYFLQVVQSEIRYVVHAGFSLSAESGHFTLNGNYKSLEDVRNKYSYLRMSAKYSVNL